MVRLGNSETPGNTIIGATSKHSRQKEGLARPAAAVTDSWKDANLQSAQTPNRGWTR